MIYTSAIVTYIDMLKVTILFASLATGFNTPAPPETTTQTVTRYQMECIEETRVDADVIVKIKANNWWIPAEQTQLVKDWALCALMKNGVLTKEGVYKVDVALSRVPDDVRDIVEQEIDSCLSQKPIPAPDIAFNFIKCFQKINSSYGALVSVF